MPRSPLQRRPRPAYPPSRRVGLAVGLSLAALACGRDASAEHRATGDDAPPRPASAPLDSYLEHDLVDIGPPSRRRGRFLRRRGYRTGGVMARVAHLRPILSASVIRRYVRAWRPRLEGCYEDELRRSPALTGRAVVRFVLRDGGLPASVHVKDTTIDSEPFERCIVEAFARIRFPTVTGSGTSIVRYPLVFRPRPLSGPRRPGGP